MKLLPASISFIHLINRAFNYVVDTSAIYKIDESHALKHSMEVYRYSTKIYANEVPKHYNLQDHQAIIYAAAIGHDMCDKKYMDEKEGIVRYQTYLSNVMNPSELEIMGDIIATMSYSKVKKNGYPDLGQYQMAYHIVREADLLAAYDIDRCIMYDMYRNNLNYADALHQASSIFDKRVLRMRQDNLFITDYSKQESLQLHLKALKEVKNLRKNL